MPYRTRRWLWAGRITAALALIGLGAYLGAIGTARAAALAAPIGLVVAVATLFAPFLLPAYELSTEPVTTTDSVAAGRDVSVSAADGSVAAGAIYGDVTVITGAGQTEATRWPVRVGQVPPLASAFQDRTGLRERVLAARTAGGGVVLTQVLSGEGGVGKSQLAASFAHQATESGADLVVWASAASAASVAETLATAAHRVRAPGSDAEADAKAFLDSGNADTASPRRLHERPSA